MDYDLILAKELGATSLKGFQYLVESMNIMSETGCSKISNLYQQIADKFGVSMPSVERNIRTYKEKVAFLLDLETIFGVKMLDNYTNKEFLFNCYRLCNNSKVKS